MMHMAPWKIWTILVICALGVIYAAPNFLTREQAAQLPAWLPHQQINVGLDLQGGSHLLLEVDFRAVLRDRARNLEDAVVSAMRQQRIVITDRQRDENTGSVTFRVRDPGQLDAARNAVRDLDRTAQVEVGANQSITL